MHAITFFVAIVGAGRQSKSTHTTHIDTADDITGHLGVQSTEDTPVASAGDQRARGQRGHRSFRIGGRT